MADLLKHLHPICVTMPNLVLLHELKDVGIQENRNICGALELCSLAMGGVADPKIHASPRHVLPRQIW